MLDTDSQSRNREAPITDKCIVLDLDHTLLNTFNNVDFSGYCRLYNDPNTLPIRLRLYHYELTDVFTEPGVGVQTSITGIFRPHVETFLQFCLRYFKRVIVWSAGRTRYVEALTDRLFRDLRDPDLILTWDDCVQEPEVIKPLQQIWDLQLGCTPENTLIVDDTQRTFQQNPDNAILIPPYHVPDPDFENPDVDYLAPMFAPDFTLLVLITWLMTPEVMTSRDVRVLDKTEIFGPVKQQ